jgi:SAM-dependent methyltransferase
MKRRFLRVLHNWIVQFVDPLKAVRSLRSTKWYLRDWYEYNHLPGAEPIRLSDSWPQLHDRTTRAPFDVHYLWTNGWAMRRILAQKPPQHVDIGSQIMLVNLLSAVLPVVFLDYRPLRACLSGLTSTCGDILHLPFADRSIQSLSCLHVAEHIGLGRYGDSLNPYGTRQACAELQRILAPGGHLYFAVPVGRPRVQFNAHRIHAPATIQEYFAELEMTEFSGVDDSGRFIERIRPDALADSSYSCGMFLLRRYVETRGHTDSAPLQTKL